MLPPELDLVVHATHEAGAKVGGIGAVLEGILSQPAYNRIARRTILVGPYDPDNLTETERLTSPRNAFQVRYSTLDGVADVDAALARAFERIELYYHVNLLYGCRKFGEASHEVLLVDPHDVVASVVNRFKYRLWDKYAIDSQLYESSHEYERFVSAAEPSYAALMALAGEGDHPRPPRLRAPHPGRALILAHEWLGLPLAFSAAWHQETLSPDQRLRTVLYAHEVATVRRLVEDDPGHDTRFYNVMRAARRQNVYLEDVFGNQRDYFKHALLMAAATFDGVLAVSDVTMDELRFLSPRFASRPISLVYNGVPASPVTSGEREAARARMQDYGANLLGRKPDWIFTHVTRLVQSKGLWRDLRVMEQLDAQLAERGERSILFTLSSAIPAGRRVDDILRWEKEYGWPVEHHSENGDLIGPEIDYYRSIQQFNSHSAASQIVLVNQFGWGRERCGQRMPAEMQPGDVRTGTDLEFGQSIYEPFGIGQVEPLTDGALCVLSSVCGCVGFIKQASQARPPNIIIGDYLSLPPSVRSSDLDQLELIGDREREMVEAAEANRVADKIIERLPRAETARARLLDDGYQIAQRMSWQVVVEEGLLPALFGLF